MGTAALTRERSGSPVVNAGAIVAGDGAVHAAVVEALEREGFEATRTFERSGARAAVYLTPAHIAASVATDKVETFAVTVGGILKSAFGFLKSATAAMRAGGDGGSIVFVAPRAPGSAHDAVRQGLRLLVKSAALELGPEHIRVNIVLPGAEASPLAGAATSRNIADTVAFLASERALFITGADLVVDGGRAAL